MGACKFLMARDEENPYPGLPLIQYSTVISIYSDFMATGLIFQRKKQIKLQFKYTRTSDGTKEMS